MRTWIIGGDPGCDLVVEAPSVSGRHCRLSESAGGFLLEDLGSTNGTYVGGVAIRSPTRVAPGDPITLGRSVPMPWPAPADDRTIRIGREPDNDIVLDAPTVSGHHARIVLAGGRATIEDLGSTNGTFLNAQDPGHQITRGPLSGSDTVFFGSLAVPAARLLADAAPATIPPPPSSPGGPSTLVFRGTSMVVGRELDCECPIDLPMVSGRHARISRSATGGLVVDDLGSSNGTFVNGRRIEGPTPIGPGDLLGLGSHTLRLAVEEPRPTDPPPTLDLAPPPTLEVDVEARPGAGIDPGRSPIWRPDDVQALAALLLQAPVVAAALAMAFGGRASASATPETWGDVAGAVAGLCFALGLAAVWFGASDALWAASRRPRAPAGRASALPARLVVLGPLALIQCALLLGIVCLSGAVRAPIGPVFGLLALSSGVGLALGLAAWTLAKAVGATAGTTVAALLSLIVVMALLGGLLRPPGALERPARLVAAAFPTRWAFEGLLLLESDRRPTALAAIVGDNDPKPLDMAEPAFPAETQRMGVRACALALGAMVVGLLGLALAVPSGPRDLPGSG